MNIINNFQHPDMKHVIDQLIPEINKMVLGNLYTTSVGNLPTCEEEEEEDDED
jgi:hypothetical protein